ncbi:hypothetical protein SAY87_025192 [Trapa incisa]|uniref:Uncharacterized protein n=1 Tax=Trapa incisa TaxID=236973 RepID=A0AAN7GH92_9MYRT|nr:hypothetical protein SAY87_025192 [Trapa incisa]
MIMARSLSNARLLSAVVVDGFSSAIKRRGFSAAAVSSSTQGITGTGGRSSSSTLIPTKVEDGKVGSAHKVLWGPDPKTGYYRPVDRTEEIDVADLRAALLKQKKY